MAISSIDMTVTTGRVLDLRAHRLGELVQALTGCPTEVAELALGGLTHAGPVSEGQALDALAAALVRVSHPDRFDLAS
jgi:hypothetical protein